MPALPVRIARVNSVTVNIGASLPAFPPLLLQRCDVRKRVVLHQPNLLDRKSGFTARCAQDVPRLKVKRKPQPLWYIFTLASLYRWLSLLSTVAIVHSL